MRKDKLQETVAELVSRPGHTKVTALLYRLLVDGLKAESTLIDFERSVPEVRGRIDALLGRTVFEVKSDWTREKLDAEAQLLRYVPQREAETGQRFTGIATDGAEFHVYIVSDGHLVEIRTFKPKIEESEAFVAWLESVVVVHSEIRSDIRSIQRELGRDSVAYHRAIEDIKGMWKAIEGSEEVLLKRDIWSRLVGVAYGGNVDAPALFFQHTYLTIVAKAIATAALFDDLPKTGGALLDGDLFRKLGIVGAVEADFFDWILQAPGGDDFVMRVVRHANRFRLHDIEVDILKGLYESLIDPDQRHDLGEYYTPDWLAQRMCEKAISSPLENRVIDPACGSGTFLFHSIRRLLDAAKAAKRPPEAAVSLATTKITGIDVHPVAVIFARVTYLLALAPALRKGRPRTVSVPVYLGDALQWNAREFMNLQDLEIVVPPTRKGRPHVAPENDESHIILRFPLTLAREPARFDATLDEMLILAHRNKSSNALIGWLKKNGGVDECDVRMLRDTYEALRRLQKERRDHIWAYVARNLSRPIWLSTEPQKADVVIGNPPWLAYSRMGGTTQARFREEMKSVGLWGGLQTVSAFDLAAYFFARALWLYARQGGKIAFVLPYAALFKKPYQKFRGAVFRFGSKTEHVEFYNAWAMPSDVQPLFPVPACVVFARRSAATRPLPQSVLFFSGRLPRRDANAAEARASLSETIGPWPEDEASITGSSYRKRFRQGAILIPRRFVLIKQVQGGRLGGNPGAPLVQGRTGSQDKKPWKNITPPEHSVEAEFVRPVYLGESVLPFRLLEPLQAVIPWEESTGRVLNSESARTRGYGGLAEWLEDVETLWREHGKDRRAFAEQIDFYEQLSGQFPMADIRVLYAKAGTNPAAALTVDSKAIIDHMLYWAKVSTTEEGHYLVAVLNSEVTRRKAQHWQSQGQWGARHFDKVVFNLPIPQFDRRIGLHEHLAAAAVEAEKVAASVALKQSMHFTRARGALRHTLSEAGLTAVIDKLVSKLLSKPVNQGARRVEARPLSS